MPKVYIQKLTIQAQLAQDVKNSSRIRFCAKFLLMIQSVNLSDLKISDLRISELRISDLRISDLRSQDLRISSLRI